jgi:hypothetical protein
MIFITQKIHNSSHVCEVNTHVVLSNLQCIIRGVYYGI